MFRRVRNLWRHRRTLTPEATVDATVEETADGVIVHCGENTFRLRSPGHPLGPRTSYDFALFGLAAISLSRNIAIRFDAPVTPGAVAAIRALTNSFDLWSIPQLAPLRLTATNVLPDDDLPRGTGTAICLSGGTDSLSGALEARASGALTHGILVAGYDYPDLDHPAFIDLRGRVEAQADLLGLDLMVLETDIRSTRIDWPLTHGLCLAMAVHFFQPRLAEGRIAADFTYQQDYVAHPWGSSLAQSALYGTNLLPVRSVGGSQTRCDKVRKIVTDAPEFVPHLSVCWKTDSGGNCGTCPKCLRTRLNFLAAGMPEPGIFARDVVLADAVSRLKTSDRIDKIRNDLIFMTDIWQNLPDSPERDAVHGHRERLRRAYIARMP